MKKNTPKTNIWKWFYQVKIQYPDESITCISSITYAKTQSAALSKIKNAAKEIDGKILEIEMSIYPLKGDS